MDDNAYIVALGGLLHDIGKFMQRADFEKQHPEIEDNYGQFCPQNNFHSYTHLHAAHSAYFIENFLPKKLFDKTELTELFNAARHHKNPDGDIYKEADKLSSGMERYADETDEGNYKDVRMHSVFDLVELGYTIKDKQGHVNSRWIHNLVQLKLINPDNLNETFPVFLDGNLSTSGTYGSHWNDFQKEIESLKNTDNIGQYFNELYYLLEKYTSFIPSATNVYPDISLFDHSKTTAALASILSQLTKEEKHTGPEFILYGGDISGIQDYIFRISRAQGVGGIAKRLRGRSFYVSMLSEVLSRYLVRNLGLTIVNINFCGGGNFELILPNTEKTIKVLTEFEVKVNDWLLQEFGGNLDFVGAWVEMAKKELLNTFSDKKNELGDSLSFSKLRKYRTHLSTNDFWIEKNSNEALSICPSCNINSIAREEAICERCSLDKKIGEAFPKTGFISFSTDKNILADISIKFGEFGLVHLWSKGNDFSSLLNKDISIYALSEDSAFIKARFKFSRAMPIATKTLILDTEEDEAGDKTVRPNQPLSFTTLADMAQGDKRIGILKMDVDNLGLMLLVGLDEFDSGNINQGFRSISRMSSLSRQISNFFSVSLDDLCNRVSHNWQTDTTNNWPHKDGVSGIFYSIFAGGDDLVIVGPWDRIIELARDIRKQFKDFTCHNPNISLSAGIYVCKPKYPISIAISKADEALKQSKDNGKNRITVMGETSVWAKEDCRSRVFQPELRDIYPGKLFEENEISSDDVYVKGQTRKDSLKTKTLCFEELCGFAEMLEKHYRIKNISRRFIFRLLEGRDQFFNRNYNDKNERFEEQQNLMILPYLLYNIERNAAAEAKDELKQKLITTGEAEKYIRQAYFPCKYVLMKTRNQEG